MKYRTRSKYRASLRKKTRLERIAEHKYRKEYLAGRRYGKWVKTKRMSSILTLTGMAAHIKYLRATSQFAELKVKHFKRAGLQMQDYTAFDTNDLIKLGGMLPCTVKKKDVVKEPLTISPIAMGVEKTL